MGRALRTGKAVRLGAVAFGVVSLAACGSSHAATPPNGLSAVNRCLTAHHLSIFHYAKPYKDTVHPGDPGNGTVKLYEDTYYTVPATKTPTSTTPSFPTHAAGVVQFATARNAQAYAAYFRRTSLTAVPFASAARRAGAIRLFAWTRQSTPWAPTKVVVTCLREHS